MEQKENQPLISILMTSYNRENTYQKQLKLYWHQPIRTGS